jgi:membrane-associated protein
MAELFLTWMTIYGPLALGLALLLGPLGLPIPTGLVVMAAGASARQGLMDWSTAVILGLVATVVGDSLSYALGRFAGPWVERFARGSRAAVWERALERFRQYGGLAVYVTRVLLTALDVPTNLVAGSSRYDFKRFLVWAVAGRVTWIALYGGLGYVAGSQWQVVSQVMSQYGAWLGVVVAVGIGLFVVIRRLRRNEPAGVGDLRFGEGPG